MLYLSYREKGIMATTATTLTRDRARDQDHTLYQRGSAPALQPLNYPGLRPSESVLITAEHLLSIDSLDGLDDMLEALGAPGMSQRLPVLAIGSNASPAQLRHKFRAEPQLLSAPSFCGTAAGLVPGFTPFRAPGGYIPATPVMDSPAVTSRVTVQFLTRDELAVVDATEEPWYHRVWIGRDRVDIDLDHHDALDGVYAYVSRHGYLCVDGEPLVMGHVEEAAPTDLPLHRFAATQRDAVEWLLLHSNLGHHFANADTFSRADFTIEASHTLIAATGLALRSNPLADAA